MGLNINDKADGGYNLLRSACVRDGIYRLNLLFEYGLSLSEEIEKRVLEVAKENRSDLVYNRIRDQYIITDNNIIDGRTKLHEACSNNDLATVRKLIENGADVNAKDKRGVSPLHKACASASSELIEYLIE